LSLRANTYVALSGAAFLAVALIFAATIYAGRTAIHFAERNLAIGAMRQTSREIDAQLQSLDALAHDWGSWDAATHFMDGTDPAFVADNDPSATIAQSGNDAVVAIDVAGKPVLTRYSRKLTADATAVAAFQAAIAPGERLLATATSDPAKGASAIIPAGDGAVLIVSRPIVTSAETGPIRGTMVFARMLDKTVLTRIDTLAGTKLTAIPLDNPSIPAQVADALLVGDSDPVAVFVERPLDITAYLRVDSTDGTPALLMSSPIAPVDYDMAMRGLATLIGVFLIGGLLWTLVAFKVVDTTSLSRMTWLRDAMSAIAVQGTLQSRIELPPGGRDEVSSVAAEVNTMLDALGTSHERVRRSEEQHRVLVENMGDAVFTVGSDGTITFGNPQAEHLTGLTLEQLIGEPYSIVLAEDSVDAVQERLGRLDASNRRPLSVVFGPLGGLQTPVELSISPVLDAQGVAVATTWIARDVTERREFEEQLLRLANHDHLTGLYNRRRFEEEVARHLAETKRRGDGGALLWLDLDHFKEINDGFGHRVGDEVLTRTAVILRERTRDGQVLARLGGDEFAMLLPGADEQEAIQAAERVLSELAATPVHVNESVIRISASIGIALYPSQATSVDELLLRGDVAMYRAKESGRNRTCVFSPDEVWPEQLAARRAWADRIESALADNAFVAYAQPILDLRTNQITAYELLVRMVAPDGSVVFPGEFLSAAEDIGLITEIDRVMVRHAVTLASMPLIRASGLRLYVNLSAKTLSEAAFPLFVRAQFEESGVDPHQIGFELTETALVANMARAHQLIGLLRDLGCSFALDDFGSGFSSITYLRHMPVDVLKIDGSLVREMLTNQQDQHLVRAIIELARCLDIEVTAEYVENEQTLELLKSFGADYVQGYYLAEPKPAREVLLGDFDVGGGAAS
jgi:diguanylate cyclase (GGDEF)-like protein/PAS domain S-box-containing protein